MQRIRGFLATMRCRNLRFTLRFWPKRCHFWATVCKSVRPMLSDRCLSCLYVTLVYCGQTVGWIKIKLGVEVGLGSGHIVLDGDPAPLPKRAQPPIFGPCLSGQTAGWINMPLGM